MLKILSSLTVAVILLSAVGITTVKAGDTLTVAQPFLPVSEVQKNGSYPGLDLDKNETSRNPSQDPFTYAKLVQLVWQHGIRPTYRLKTTTGLKTICQAEILLPGNTLEKLIGISEADLYHAGMNGVGHWNGDSIYTFEVDPSFCSGKGGGSSLQFTAIYIWLLIFLAILAMIFATKNLGGKLKQQTI